MKSKLLNLLVTLTLVLTALSAPALASSDKAAATIPDQPAGLPNRNTPRLQATPATTQPPPQPGPELHLAAGAFDPRLESASFLPDHLMLDAYPAGVAGYYIVQFDGPILPQWKAALESAGAQLFDYIPDFGFVVKMDAQIRAAVETLPHVRWVGLHQPGFRLAPVLFDGVLPAGAVPQQLLVVVFPGEDLLAVLQQLEALGGEVMELSQSHWKSQITLAIDPSLAAQVAAINGVRWVGPVPVYEPSNNETADIIGVRPVWDNHGLYGAGQIVGVCDTGLDQGSTAPASLHDDFEDGSGSSRVIALYDLVGGGDGAEDRNSGHGTHVAGSVLGNGDLSGADPTNHSFPSTSYAGMAPDAELVFQAVEDDAGGFVGIPADLNDLFIQAYNAGARIHSNSWAMSGVPYGSYSPSSEDVDEFVWDHPNFLPLFAAANEGIDENGDGVIDLNSVPPPGSAKNCVTVGATENDRPSGSTPPGFYDGTWGTGWPPDYPANPVRDDHVSDVPNGMAAFSGRGPTLDGRYKPDVVSPGTNIASVRSSLATGTGWGVLDANYMFMGGTSMATPLAAGATALIREWYTRIQMTTPSAALMKATLVNGASDIYPGQYGTGATQEITLPAPNNVEGWGRVNIEDSIFPSAPRRFQYVDERGGLDTNEVHTYTFEVVADSVPLHANLVWSDYPGATAAAGGLVNDLDLTLYGPGGGTFYPIHAVQRGASQHLSYDDWGAESGRGTASTVQIAVRFTPTFYPATVDKGLFFLGSTTTYPQTVNYYVYDDDGTGGAPGTVLASGSATIRRWDWHVIDLSGYGVTIPNGDFYLAIDHIGTNPMWTADTTAPTNNRALVFFGGSWLNYNTAFGVSDDVMFHAIVRGTDPSTSQDRVNNVVGIHVPTTSLQTGRYALTVRGYNVPQGPQPYALTLNGGLAELLDIDKIATPDPAGIGTLLTYTVHITNTGIATATQVLLTETYDSNVTYQSASPTPDSGNDVWNLGEIGSGQERFVTITVRTAGSLSAGDILTNVATVDSVQTEPRAVTITTPITAPMPAWNKQVYVNGVLTDTFPVTLASSDALSVVDRVLITYTGSVTFTLVETWTESLDLMSWISDTGNATQVDRTLTWEVRDAAPNTWHAITKTFDVLSVAVDTDTITESLWVEHADPQLGERVLSFNHLYFGVTISPPTDTQSGDPGATVTYTLRVTNTGNVVDSFDIDLSGNAWPADAPPAIGPLTAGSGADVQVTVDIPADAGGGEDDTVAVSATSQQDGSVSASSLLTSTANAFYGVTIAPPTDALAGAAGTTVTYTLRVTNTGNAQDSFDLVASGNTWTTTLPAAVNLLAAGAGQDIQVAVDIPASAAAGEDDSATITASSQGNPAATASSTLTTTAVVPSYGVAIAPSTDAQSGDPGTTVTYTLRVTNTGNVQDSFDLVASGNTWTTTLPAAVNLLAAGAGQDVQVTVDIPAAAAAGEDDSATITASSQGNPAATASSMLTTTVTGFNLYLPLVTKNY